MSSVLEVKETMKAVCSPGACSKMGLCSGGPAFKERLLAGSRLLSAVPTGTLLLKSSLFQALPAIACGRQRRPLRKVCSLSKVGLHTAILGHNATGKSYTFKALADDVSAQFDSSQDSAEEVTNQNDESEKDEPADEYVEIGIVVGTHGVKGEVVVRSLTDFPKKRFGTPGVRWFRRPGRRQQALIEVELLKGRKGPSRKGKDDAILLKFEGIDTPEDAATYQGCSLLALADDRPELQADEFYTRDLVGVEVVLQETGQVVGTVEDVFSVGARDLLKVKRTDLKTDDESKVFHSWVPFVEEIVPVVDMTARRIKLTPPKGLLDMNIKLGPTPAEQRRQKVLAQIRRKREIGKMRKEFARGGQAHLMAGLSEGGETEREELLQDLKTLDLKSLRSALDSAQTLAGTAPVKPYPPPPFPKAVWGDQGLEPTDDPLKSAGTATEAAAEGGQNGESTEEWWREGLRMVARGEVATMVLAGGQGTRLGPQAPPAKGMLDIGLPSGKSLFQLQAERLRKVQELAKQSTEDDVTPVPAIPWLIMTSEATDGATRHFFEENAHFGLDPTQILFVKQGNMPCVSLKTGNPILLETPWKVARSPDGNGGVFEALHASGGIEWLRERGVKYVQAYAVDNALVKVADPVFFGYCGHKGADVGIKVVSKKYPEESVGVVCLKEEGGESADEGKPRDSVAELEDVQAEGSSREAMEKELVGRIMEATGLSESEARREMERMEAEIAASDFEEDDESEGEWYEDEFEGDDDFSDDDTEFFIDGSQAATEEPTAQRGSEPASTSGRRYYSVLEYSELPQELIHARDPPSDAPGVNTPGELQFRAAHICVNMFSLEFLSRLGGENELSLPFHLAKKKISHVVHKETGWREVTPEAPNGIKLERFIFDAFKFCPEDRVAVLEVEREEEFAPIKNASGPGVPDSPETAREMVLGYHRRLLAAAGVELGGASVDGERGTETETDTESGTEEVGKNGTKKGKKGKKEKGKADKGKKDKGKEKKEKNKGKKDKAVEESVPEKKSEESEVDVLALGEIPPLLSYAGEGLGSLVQAA